MKSFSEYVNAKYANINEAEEFMQDVIDITDNKNAEVKTDTQKKAKTFSNILRTLLGVGGISLVATGLLLNILVGVVVFMISLACDLSDPIEKYLDGEVFEGANEEPINEGFKQYFSNICQKFLAKNKKINDLAYDITQQEDFETVKSGSLKDLIQYVKDYFKANKIDNKQAETILKA